MSPYIILISGAGQLGSRYLQGLVKSSLPLSIWVADPSDSSLVRAGFRWREAGGNETKHSLSFVSSLSEVPSEVDLVIVSTSASVRADVVEEIASRTRVCFWVLEKVLAQSDDDLERLIQATAESKAVWVNIPRRMMRWYQEIAAKIAYQKPSDVLVRGGNWGLTCNSVHFLDLGAYLFKEALVEIHASGLHDNWYASKRAGFYEVNGILRAKFTGDKWLTLHCMETDGAVEIEITTDNGLWQISEGNGEAVTPDGKYLYGELENQSDMTSRLVESILETGACELPSLDEALVLHRPFLNALIMHWNRSQNREDIRVPIT